MPIKLIREFIQLETLSGILLALTALLGLIFANSPVNYFYHAFLSSTASLPISTWQLSFSSTTFINDGLMTFFFLLVGLEIKREMLIGELNSRGKILLPAIAAIAGMLVPALIYLLCNFQHRDLLRGWAIPTATDIAFALAVLSLLGKHIPLSLKVFLTALAIFDDLGAIVIIALVYTDKLNSLYLLASASVLLLLCLLNYLGSRNFSLYATLGVLLWCCILHTGIHPTIAGVLFALTIPLDQNQPAANSLLRKLEHRLHPWVAFLVLPLFAFVNTGVTFHNFNSSILFSSLPLGIFLGLFIGKQLGIFSAIWLSIKLRLAPMPKNATWPMLYGIALLCGIGFTMSLFIGDLAFKNSVNFDLIRTGVLAGSLLSGICGYLLLRQNAKHMT